jgi:biopolymer transport protein ExbD
MNSEGVDPNLTPLLDLVLQLIMFFMITVNFIRVDQFDDSIRLPKATKAAPIEASAEKYVFMNLNPKGELVGTLASAQLDTPGKIQAFLHGERERNEREAAAQGRAGPVKVVVILRADKDVRYERMWEVLDACKRAGFAHWQLRAKTAD